MIGFVGAFQSIFNIKLLWSEFCYVSLLLFTVVFIYLYPFLFLILGLLFISYTTTLSLIRLNIDI